MIVSRHWFGIVMLMMLAGGILLTFALMIFRASDDSAILLGLSSIILITVVAATAIIFTIARLIYFNNSLTLTRTGLYQQKQLAVFSNKNSYLGLANIEDVTVTQRGIFQTFLDFGTLTIETAGEQNNFQFQFCPQPNYCAEVIRQTRDQYLEANPTVADKVN